MRTISSYGGPYTIIVRLHIAQPRTTIPSARWTPSELATRVANLLLDGHGIFQVDVIDEAE